MLSNMNTFLTFVRIVKNLNSLYHTHIMHETYKFTLTRFAWYSALTVFHFPKSLNLIAARRRPEARVSA